jgi:hypothetical protein
MTAQEKKQFNEMMEMIQKLAAENSALKSSTPEAKKLAPVIVAGKVESGFIYLKMLQGDVQIDSFKGVETETLFSTGTLWNNKLAAVEIKDDGNGELSGYKVKIKLYKVKGAWVMIDIDENDPEAVEQFRAGVDFIIQYILESEESSWRLILCPWFERTGGFFLSKWEARWYKKYMKSIRYT